MVGLLAVVALVANIVRSGFPATKYFPKWVAIWLVISSMICTCDASFVFNRVTSLDSFNTPIWSPYKDYVQVDKLYASLDNDFVWSQSVLNVLEICLNLFALHLLTRGKDKKAAALALAVSAMTSSKTILYHVMEYSCGGCNTKQNDWPTLLTL